MAFACGGERCCDMASAEALQCAYEADRKPSQGDSARLARAVTTAAEGAPCERKSLAQRRAARFPFVVASTIQSQDGACMQLGLGACCGVGFCC
jgi:hypothetical protein